MSRECPDKSYSVVTIDEQQQGCLSDYSVRLGQQCSNKNTRRFYEESARMMQEILTLEQLRDIRAVLLDGGPAAVLLSHLPTEDFGSCFPSTGNRPAGLSFRSDALLYGVASIIGHPIGYSDEHSGDLVHEIANVSIGCPVYNSQHPDALNPHTDRSRYPEDLRPSVLLLLGMNNPEHLPTRFVLAGSVARSLSESVRENLFRARYEFGLPSGRFQGLRSILSSVGSGIEVTLPPEELPSDEESSSALAAFRSACIEQGEEVEVNAGKMLILSNSRSVHFRDRNESPERWLRRMYVTVRYQQLSRDGKVGLDDFVVA